MRKCRRHELIGTIALVTILLGAGVQDEWVAHFHVEDEDLVTVGRNLYFILEPGHYLVLEGGAARLTITVLDETRIVDGAETRVVEERETWRGRLVEVSRNFFAINERTGDVYYFGEDVDMYRDGRVASHRGAWRSGVDEARFGLMMRGGVALHAKYYQEIAPGVAMDRAEIVGTDETVSTAAGEFTHCVKVAETTPLEPQVREIKYYAPGIGMVRDGPLALVRAGRIGDSTH